MFVPRRNKVGAEKSQISFPATSIDIVEDEVEKRFHPLKQKSGLRGLDSFGFDSGPVA